MKKYLFCLNLIILLVSCTSYKKYYNFKSKYQIKYPADHLILTNQKKHSQVEKFKQKIEDEPLLFDYKTVDLIICNDKALPPAYDFIAVNSIPGYVNIYKMNKQLLESLLILDLTYKFQAIQVLKSQFVQFGRYNCYSLELSFLFQKKQFFSTNIIVPGNIFSTQIMTTIYEQQDKDKIMKKLTQIILSYKRI